MVCRFGMSDRLGPVAFGREQQQVFLGRDFAQEDRNYSEQSAEAIDEEVRRLIEEAAAEALRLLTENRECLENITKTLLKEEILRGDEFDAILEKEIGADKLAAARGEPKE